MPKKTKIILSIFSLLIILLLAGCGCKQPNPHQYNMNLEIWGFDDDNENLQPIFENYKKLDPNIKDITYRKLTVDTYEKEVIDALASGQGPDIFLIKNTWLPGFVDKIVPAPTGTINEQGFRNSFPDVAANDFIKDGQIYAMPLSIDSLGLYYNKDLFNAAGITAPPQDWNQFVEDVKKLTRVNSSGEIVQSGASLGTSSTNINRATDVLNMLMTQEDFALPIINKTMSPNTTAGENAITFYTQFANSASPYYAWNANKHYSVDAFSEGTLAMMFNYSWHIQTIMNKSPKLNFGIAPIPQFSDSTPTNYANYWAFAVAKNKIIAQNTGSNATSAVSNDTRILEAWKFLVYLTTKGQAASAAPIAGSSSLGNVYDPNFDPADSYIKATGKPAARRDLIEAQKSDPMLGAFATGNLIDQSWPQLEPESDDGVLDDMINQINRGQANVHDALSTAIERIKQLQGINN